MVADGHYRYLDALRSTLAIVINPLQHGMNAPVRLSAKVGDFFVAQGRLKSENAGLKEQQLVLAARMLQYQAVQAENLQLRNLLQARTRHAQHTTLAESRTGAFIPCCKGLITMARVLRSAFK